MNNNDINTEFSSFIETYTRQNPSKRLSEIAKRRNIELSKLNLSSLKNPDADAKAMSIWRQAKSDLKLLIDPMSSTVWNLAYKYFSDVIFGCESDAEKKEAISDEFQLPATRIDAENELKNIIKKKVCETSYTIAGNTYELFSNEDAVSKTPQELCNDIDDRLTKMSSILDQDAKDRDVYNDVQKNHTFEDYFIALAEFLDKKVGEILKNGNMNIYKFSYDAKTNSLVGKHIRTGLDVVNVSPSIGDEDDTGPLADLICDIDVAGLGLPETHPLLTDTKEMTEVISYKTRHGIYSPGEDGQYTIPGVKGSEVPSIVYNAVQDWQATSSACHTVTKAWTDAHELLGEERMDDLKANVYRNQMVRDLSKSKGYSTKHPEVYKDEVDELNTRANLVKPKVDRSGKFQDDDISNILSKVQIALSGKTADGSIFTDEELEYLDGIDDEIEYEVESELETPDPRV